MVSRGLLTFSGRGGSCWCPEPPGMQFLWPQALLLPWLAGAECIHLPGGLKARYLCSIRWWICPSSSMGKQKYFEHYSLVLTVNNFLWFPPEAGFDQRKEMAGNAGSLQDAWSISLLSWCLCLKWGLSWDILTFASSPLGGSGLQILWFSNPPLYMWGEKSDISQGVNIWCLV